MKTYSNFEVNGLSFDTKDCEEDFEGQLVIYTGIFVWGDGTYHDEPETADNS